MKKLYYRSVPFEARDDNKTLERLCSQISEAEKDAEDLHQEAIRMEENNSSSSSKSENEVQNHNMTAHIHAALWPKNDMELLAQLLQKHPHELATQFGMCRDTLLHRACRYGNKKAVYILLQKGANVNCKNVNGETPLHLACINHNHNADIVRMLVDAGANYKEPNIEGDCPTHIAVQGGNLEILQLLLSQSDVCENLRGAFDNTLLHCAAEHGQLIIAQFLISQGHSVNVRNGMTETPLHSAAGCYHKGVGTELVEVLLDAGAVLQARTTWGDTAAHYAAQSGTLDVLKFLCEEGISVSKPKARPEEAVRLCQKFSLADSTAERMRYSLLQKVARSSCINKATYILDKMMHARNVMGANVCRPFMGKQDREVAFFHRELNQQETEFLIVAKEFRHEMTQTGSAFKLFVKYTPDALEHLFNRCITSFCAEQVQGKIFFDFFMFNHNQEESDRTSGELTLPQMLITYGKEHFLLHPIFETFLRLKWQRTWKAFAFFLLMYMIHVVSIVGYALTHFGNDRELDQVDYNGWWYFLAVMNTISILGDIKVLGYFIREIHRFRKEKEDFTAVPTRIGQLLFAMLGLAKTLLLSILPCFMLYTDIDHEVKRYLCAITVILACFELMLFVSRLPKMGVYIFMLQKVFVTIMRFFGYYIWHFLGYAIAFHIMMPRKGAFLNLGDSIIKVLTMLMGEYDFTDNFTNEDTFWVSKVIFVIFVIDMSMVLMNLVLGLAVSDVESIQRDSNVQRLMHETFTVLYLEQLYKSLYKLPLIGHYFCGGQITSDNSCMFKEVVFLDLVDVVDNRQNKIVVDGGKCSEETEEHGCPKTIVLSVVKILQQRLNVITQKQDPVSAQVIAELKEQNNQMTCKVEQMEDQLKTLLQLVNEINDKLKSS